MIPGAAPVVLAFGGPDPVRNVADDVLVGRVLAVSPRGPFGLPTGDGPWARVRWADGLESENIVANLTLSTDPAHHQSFT